MTRLRPIWPDARSRRRPRSEPDIQAPTKSMTWKSGYRLAPRANVGSILISCVRFVFSDHHHAPDGEKDSMATVKTSAGTRKAVR